MALPLLGMVLLFARGAQAAAGGSGRDAVSAGAVVSGVVRDAQGVAQMGALVEVLTFDSATVRTAFTDLRGRYAITNLNAGRYLVRASATMFAPATRSNLQLRTGGAAVVNLTLAALFNTQAWLPAERRRADEPEDDWKWTLRSSANRPILRVVDDGTTMEVSTSAAEHRPVVRTQVRETVASGDGEFGEGGVHNVIAIHRSLDDGGDMLFRADVGSSRVPALYGASEEFDAGYERSTGMGGAARTVVSYKAHPELLSAGATGGLETFSIASGQRMEIGDGVDVEVGGAAEFVHTAEYGMVTHPFLRLTARPGSTWTLQYKMATDPTLQGFEDVTTGRGGRIPVALMRAGQLAVESSRHQEGSFAHQLGPAVVQATYYRDSIEHAAVGGSGFVGGGVAGPATGELATNSAAASTALGTSAGTPAGMLVDPTTGTFRALGRGYHSNGARLALSARVAPEVWVETEFSTGSALAAEGGGSETFDQAMAGLKVKNSQAATIALRGKLLATGTRVRASYRWQPVSLVTAVDAYSAREGEAYLSFMLRQPVHWAGRLPRGLDATVDVRNLLAQGYRPFLSADGQTLYLAQAPRAMQAGLSFTF